EGQIRSLVADRADRARHVDYRSRRSNSQARRRGDAQDGQARHRRSRGGCGGRGMTAVVPFELAVDRHIDAPPETGFKVWTGPLEEWWAPKPWTTRLIEQDLRPGGRTAMVMRGPDGETSPIEGVVLEVVPNRRIVFTDAFAVGWIPRMPFMIGFFEF